MIPTKVKFKAMLNVPKVRKKVEASRDKALDRAGAILRRQAGKQFRRRAPQKKPIWKMVGTHEGYPLVSMNFQPSTQGRITTWKPKEFLRRKIQYKLDPKRGTVVIGPDEKVARIQQLQEFGGSEPVKLKLVAPVPVDGLYQYKVPKSMLGRKQGRDRRGRFISNQRAYIGMWHSQKARVKGKTVLTDPGRVPAAAFMGKASKASRRLIPQQFRNQLRGP